MSDLLCPHRVPNRQWGFRDEMPAPMQGRILVVLNSESCPDCLRERVKNLRAAFEALLEAGTPDVKDPPRRAKAEDAFRLYYGDIEAWGP